MHPKILEPARRTAPSETFVEAFAASMPDHYRERFDQETIRAHAGVVFRRGTSASRAEPFRMLPEGGLAVCIVADDRPGLFSRISAALFVHHMDVVAAQAYCRKTPHGNDEAVDLFWLRRLPGYGVPFSITPGDVTRMGEVLDALVRSGATLDSAVRFAAVIRDRRLNETTTVRFAECALTGRTLLSMETDDRPGLLCSVSAALRALDLQIVRMEARTARGRALDVFHLAEQGGGPLGQGRQLEVQEAVLAAIDLRG
jgi:[protein-PII] uridylyltransferase